MISYPTEKLGLFIDGSNLYNAARALDFDIDYKKLLQFFAKNGRLLRAFYYTALIEDQEYSPIRPLVDWLDYNGYTMITKPAKEYIDSSGRRKIKGNMDIELAVDVMGMSNVFEHIVLFSGDGDFCRLVEATQRKGVRVSVVSTVRSHPPMVSDELRRQADNFIELQDLAEHIRRDHAKKPLVKASNDYAGEDPVNYKQEESREDPLGDYDYFDDDDGAEFDAIDESVKASNGGHA